MSGVLVGLPGRCHLHRRVSCGVHREGGSKVKEAAKKMFWIGLLIGAVVTIVFGWVFIIWLFRNLW